MTIQPPFRKIFKKNDYFFSRENLFKDKLISIIKMIFPLKEPEGFTYTEHINLKNGLNIIRKFDKIISALPESRRLKSKKREKNSISFQLYKNYVKILLP